MQATSTLERPVTTPAVVPPSRSWSRAFRDLREGYAMRQLWAHLGWQDIKQRYRRSVIGPLWITISMGVTAVGLGVLYSVLFDTPWKTFLPYVVVGFIVWNFINGCLTEGMDTFIVNEGMIKQMPAPLSVYVLRTVWRQVLMLAHNMVIYVVMLAIFFQYLDHPYTMTPGSTVIHPGLGWNTLLVVPGAVLLAINGTWVALLLGIISTRFRDIPQVISSVLQLVFYLTPIIWSPDTFLYGNDQSLAWARVLFQFNPLYHFVQVMRGPLIGQVVSPVSWLVVAGFTIVGWAVALVAMRNYRARVSYWV
ncbi:MAG TPA: ABC transporter permease [Pseudonocardiaceae bacterium]